MKKAFLPVLAVALSIALTACGNKKEDSESSEEISSETSVTSAETTEETTEKSSISENIFTESSEVSAELQTCTVDDISFSVDGSWEPLSGYNGTFSTPQKTAVYQLQGVSCLGSYTPEDFFKTLLDEYSRSNEIISSDDKLTPFVTADGIDSYVGRIEMNVNNIFFSIDLLIVPQKNTVVTFAAQAADKDTLPVDIREITNTAEINIAKEDYITGNTFIASDDSELFLKDGGEFIYYQKADDHNQPYCTGKYEVYHGQEAFDKLESMPEYGLTEEELEQTLSANMNGYKRPDITEFLIPDDYYRAEEVYQVCRDSFYTVILHNEKLVESDSTSNMDNDSVYFGFYIPELEYADMTNAATANHAGWIRNFCEGEHDNN